MVVGSNPGIVPGPPKSLLSWIRENPSLYPFKSEYLELGAHKLHYIDEGSGKPVFMIHGNPTWSFFYRKLIPVLSKFMRVIVPDHVGCGLSDRPSDSEYKYNLESRLHDLDKLINHVAPTGKINLVVHDWGGMIGTSWAVRNAHRIESIVFLNTAGFGLPKGKPLPWTLKVCRSGIFGSLLVRGFNGFCLGAARYCPIKGLDRNVRAGFLSPYSSWKDRLAIFRFVQDIPISPDHPSYNIIEETRLGLTKLDDIPKVFCWGRHDFIFNDDFLAEWKKHFPNAQYHVFEDAGHYLLEDAPEGVCAKVQEFFMKHAGG
ncbi:MAG: alpha/beta fold hydrolase [Gemmataceae bacterium]|jgi:pimeloyl-ACP methyl ester carboxylesterase